MIIGPKYKICRRLGDGTFEKCQLPAFQQRKNRGQINRPRKHKGGQRSDYAIALIEKQRIRFGYGITERQLSNYVAASRLTGGNVAETLYRKLERRLDNVVYRMGLASTRRLARQLVSHGHIIVNGRRTTIPSYEVREGDVVMVRTESKRKAIFQNDKERFDASTAPAWLSVEKVEQRAVVSGVPVFDQNVEAANLGIVIGFYSRV
jgi:small subunit ribosomal protein S4